MGKKIAVVGVGAVGGYTAAHMVRAGEDVTFLDMWPAHVDEMKENGLRQPHWRAARRSVCPGSGPERGKP